MPVMSCGSPRPMISRADPIRCCESAVRVGVLHTRLHLGFSTDWSCPDVRVVICMYICIYVYICTCVKHTAFRFSTNEEADGLDASHHGR